MYHNGLIIYILIDSFIYYTLNAPSVAQII